ncbi:carboxylesterase family protein [Kribbella qitaiheensis]|uniref:Carboxylic ester hydrolase n=1 Tax=Kribbella qitaiheensis TaxID=1544730 RepID=A0A7G6WV14_9ACTN|nr:carboxylesterase family protein [Kribbella qitaiheensis]QNE17829.1 carboxylesterase family protein [Kribbella qitaiheensis]
MTTTRITRSKLRLAVALALLPAALLVNSAAAAQSESAPPTDANVVRTDAGVLRGATSGGARVFNGVPYAAPPVGGLRWKAPQPVKPWQGEREAVKLSSACPQSANPEVPDGSTDEDCLYLNITTPAAQATHPRAIVVWIPGGGFFSGAGNSYGAAKLATRGDVVVVTMNYRLGIFGFFGYPGLAGSGTYGIQDQQAALRWVQRNARAFGGDPRNVTVAGESAGGMSVCAQLTSPTATGLFSKAVMQSGSCAFNWADNSQYPGQAADSPWVSQSTVQNNGKEWAAASKKDLGCKPGQAVLSCLRAANPAVLVDSTLNFTQVAYGGTAVLPLSPAKAMKAGLFHRVPVLSGNNHDEASAWMAAFNGGKITDADYPRLVTDMVGAADAKKVLREYPLAKYESAKAAWTVVTTDRIWSCTQIANDQQAARKVPVYAYEFADKHSPITQPGNGAAHAVELPYLFSLGGYDFPMTDGQQRLSEQMLDYWTAFARTGNPNGPDRPQWAPASKHAITGLSLAPAEQGGIKKVALQTEHHCDFWAGLSS